MIQLIVLLIGISFLVFLNVVGLFLQFIRRFDFTFPYEKYISIGQYLIYLTQVGVLSTIGVYLMMVMFNGGYRWRGLHYLPAGPNDFVVRKGDLKVDGQTNGSTNVSTKGEVKSANDDNKKND